MGTTMSTLDFGAVTIRIWNTFNCARIILVKAGPTTASVKFTFRRKQRRIATATEKSTFFVKIIILTGKRSLGAFVNNNLFFFWTEWVVGHIDYNDTLCHQED